MESISVNFHYYINKPEAGDFIRKEGYLAHRFGGSRVSISSALVKTLRKKASQRQEHMQQRRRSHRKEAKEAGE